MNLGEKLSPSIQGVYSDIALAGENQLVHRVGDLLDHNRLRIAMAGDEVQSFRVQQLPVRCDFNRIHEEYAFTHQVMPLSRAQQSRRVGIFNTNAK